MFHELVIVLKETDIAYLHLEIPMFETLRKMHEVKPFQLVFLLEIWGSSQCEGQRNWGRSLDLVVAKGLLNFLDSPPTIRSARFRRVKWYSSF